MLVPRTHMDDYRSIRLGACIRMAWEIGIHLPHKGSKAARGSKTDRSGMVVGTITDDVRTRAWLQIADNR